jgi:hypothetical protein
MAMACAQLVIPVVPELARTERVPRRQRMVVHPLPSDFPEILHRPIFATDRQPIIEPMEGISLLGAGSVGEDYMVLLQAGEQVVRAHVGDQLMGWRITALARDRAFFQRGDEKRMLLLDLKSRRAAMTPPAVPRSQ